MSNINQPADRHETGTEPGAPAGGSIKTSRREPSSRLMELPAATRRKLRRLGVLLVGLALLAGGSILAHAEFRDRPPYVETLNTLFRLDLDNLAAALASIPLFVLGTVLVLRCVEAPAARLGSERPPDGRTKLQLPPVASRRGLLLGLIGVGLANLSIGATGYNAGVALLLVAGLVAIGAALFLWDRDQGIRPRLALAKADAYILLGLTLLGVLILTYRLENLPRALVGDEGAFFIDAKRIAAGIESSGPFGFGTYTFPGLGSHIQGAVVRLFGPSVWAWRFASALPTALTIPALYVLVNTYLDRRRAIAACVLFVTLPFTLSYSRLGYNAAQILPFAVVTATFILLAESQVSTFWAFTAGAVAGFGSLTYLSSRILPMAAIAYYAAKVTFDKPNRRRHLVSGAIFTAGVFLAVSLHLTLGMTSDRESLGLKTTESILTNITYARGFFPAAANRPGLATVRLQVYEHVADPLLVLRLIVRGTFRTVAALFHGGVANVHFLVGPLAGGVGSLFFLIGAGSMLKVERRHPLQFLTLWLLMGLLSLSALTAYPPQSSHLTGILPLIPIFTSIGLALVVDSLHQCLPRIGWRGRVVLLSGLVGLMALLGLRAFFHTMPQEYKPYIEDAMSWAALEHPERDIFYLHTDAGRAELEPFLIWVLPIDVSYRNRYLDEQSPGQVRLPTSGEATVFAIASDAPMVARLVRQQWGDGTRVETIVDREERPRIFVFKNGDFPLYPQRGLLANLWASYWRTPARWVIAIAALVPLALLVGTDLLRRFWRWLPQALIWLTETDDQDGGDPEEDLSAGP